MKTNTKMIIFFIGISQLAGIIGSIFTTSSIPNWYLYLNKPSFSPPNFLFGPVWLTLYTLMGISTYLIWKKEKKITPPVKLFLIHLFFNCIWSIIFFGMKNLGLALADILILLSFIVVLIYKYWKINKVSALLLVPYLAWVSFASILNYSLWMLNR